MGTKEVKIVAPDSYEIDIENSTPERIILKKKDNKPRTWIEFCDKYEWTGEEYYMSGTGYTKTKRKEYDLRSPINRGYVSNKEEAEAFLALMQLRQLRKSWVGDWEPNWKNCNRKYVIEPYNDGIRFNVFSYTSSPLSFPIQKMAEEFIECFKDLLEQAKMLL